MARLGGWAILAVVVAAALPGGLIRLAEVLGIGHLAMAPFLAALVFGVAILAAASVLSWAAEVVEKDISQALALAFVALITVLPEYMVDLYFALKAGADPAGPYVHYAAANMTGANRLLVGLGWPLVVLLFWLKRRRPMTLDRGLSLEVVFVGVATLYVATIPIKGSIALYDGAVLLAIYGAYLWLSARAEHVEPDLMGPAAALGATRPPIRRASVVLLFLFSAAVIIGSAEPFAEGLLEAGARAGVDQFIMVQWVAPLASEAPEIAVASIFALRGQVQAAMIAMVSAKVNQWTLLVGSLPIVYVAAMGQWEPAGLPLDARQAGEVWLTAAQSIFAVVLLSRLHLGKWGALLLLLLWAGQLAMPGAGARYGFAAAYLALSILLLARDPGRVVWLVRSFAWTVQRPAEALHHAALNGPAAAPASPAGGDAGGRAPPGGPHPLR